MARLWVLIATGTKLVDAADAAWQLPVAMLQT